MTYHSPNKRLLYKNIKTRKYKETQRAGASSETVVSTGQVDSSYPVEFAGFHVSDGNVSLETFIQQVNKESGFLQVDGSLQLPALDFQIYKDIYRMVLQVNQQNVFHTFQTLTKESVINEKLTNLKKLGVADYDAFVKGLQEVYPLLRVEEQEYHSIQQLALEEPKETIVPNYWAIIPYYDALLNEKGIFENTLQNVKTLSQQSIGSTLLHTAVERIALGSTFYYQLHISDSLQNFGSAFSEEYISSLNPQLQTDVHISHSNDMVIQNRKYFSLLNVDNEFGLAIINTCLYSDFAKNKYFILWKIERWRNEAIEQFYSFVIQEKKSFSESSLLLMQKYLYNHEMADSYPLSQKKLVMYYTMLGKKMFSQQENQQTLTKMNRMIQQELNKKSSEAILVKKIKNEMKKLLTVKERFASAFTRKATKPTEDSVKEAGPSTTTSTEEKDNRSDENPSSNSINNINNTIQTEPIIPQEQVSTIEGEQTVNQDNIPEENTRQENIVEKEEDELKEDLTQIQQLENQLNEARQKYSNDHEKLQTENSIAETSVNVNSDTNSSTNKIALGSSLLGLGGIGAGLYFGLPLLLGGKTQKYFRKRNKITRKNKT